MVETSLTLTANTMEPGLYRVKLISQFPDFPGQPFISDFEYVKFKLPGLVPLITDSAGGVNPTRTVFKDSTVNIHSSKSYDPAAGLPSVAMNPLMRNWTCSTGTITRDDVELFFATGNAIASATENCDGLIATKGRFTARSTCVCRPVWGKSFTSNVFVFLRVTFRPTTCPSVSVYFSKTGKTLYGNILEFSYMYFSVVNSYSTCTLLYRQ